MSDFRMSVFALAVAGVIGTPAFGGVESFVVKRACGSVVEKAVAREAVGQTARSGLKAAANRTMSSALAGLSAKKAIGIGVGVGFGTALPVAAHELADGEQQIMEAEADGIRTKNEVIGEELHSHPELIVPVVEAMGERSHGVLGGLWRGLWRVVDIVAWTLGGVALLWLCAWLLKAMRFLRGEIRLWRSPIPLAVSDADEPQGKSVTKELK